MPQAPAADQRRLLDVQDADTRITQAKHRRAKLPVLAQLHELSGRLSDLETVRGQALVEVSDIQREVTKAEDDVQAVRARAVRDNAKLNSGEGTPRDLQALQSELEALAKRQAALEDVELEAMERLEEAQGRVDSAIKQIAAITAHVAELEAARDHEFAAIDAELEELAAARAAAAQGIEPGLLALFEKIRSTSGGVGAARLVGGQCQGCHMSINSVELARIENASDDDVVRCEDCGRILVRGANA